MVPPRIFLSPPDVGSREIDMVLSALESGWVAPVGPDLSLFEEEVSKICGRAFGIGVSSGTAALHLALLTIGVEPGDFVVCSTMTFVATANAISYVGGIPVFVDSDGDSGNMSPELLEAALDSLEQENKKVAAVVPVDFLGKSADYSRIMEICNSRGIPVVADAAESLGASHGGKPAGSFGQIAIISFNGNKIATTSGGGMVLTDDEEFAGRIRHLATQAREPVVHYEHIELGYNYRLSNILAALGRAQVERLPQMIANRRELRARYRELFRPYPEATVFGGDDSEDNCWLTSITVAQDSAWSAPALQEFLESKGIESRPLWKPMHVQPLYLHCEKYVDGTSEDLFNRGLALPSGSNMTAAQWERIESAVSEFLGVSRSLRRAT